MRKITSIAIHCAATKASMDIGRDEINGWHEQRKFSNGPGGHIGYHFVIRRDGAVEAGRPLERSGAHVKGHNAHSIGICMVGGIDGKGRPENNFTDAQFNALEELLAGLLKQFPRAEVKGHRDYPRVAKACPCFDVKTWLTGEDIKEVGGEYADKPFWNGIEHFRPDEFSMDMAPDYVRKLDAARAAAGVPFRVEKTVNDHTVVVRIAG